MHCALAQRSPGGGARAPRHHTSPPTAIAASPAFAGEGPSVGQEVRIGPGAPRRDGARTRTEDLGKRGAQGGRVHAGSPADAKDARRVAITGWPDRQGIGGLACGTVADPLGAGLAEPQQRSGAVRATLVADGDNQRFHDDRVVAPFDGSARRAPFRSSHLNPVGFRRGTDIGGASYRLNVRENHTKFTSTRVQPAQFAGSGGFRVAIRGPAHRSRRTRGHRGRPRDRPGGPAASRRGIAADSIARRCRTAPGRDANAGTPRPGHPWPTPGLPALHGTD